MTAAIHTSNASMVDASLAQQSANSFVKEEKKSAPTQESVKSKQAMPFSLAKLAVSDEQSQAKISAIRKLWLTRTDCGYLD